TLLWDDEVREPKFEALESAEDVSKRELDMAKNLVDSLSSDFEVGTFSDEYQQQLRQLIDAKLESGSDVDVSQVSEADSESQGEVVDLTDALQKSVDQRNKKTSQSSTKSNSSKNS